MKHYMNRSIFILMIFTGQLLYGQYQWTIIGEKPSTQQKNEKLNLLQKKFPTINSNAALNQLLKDISKIGNYSRIEAFLSEKKLTIRIDEAQSFKKFEIKANTRELSISMEPLLIPFRGQINSVETRGRIKNAIAKDLRSKGYFKPQLKIQTVNLDSNNLKVTLLINEGFPCIIEKVETSFQPPKGLTIPIQKGDICDKKFVDNALKDFESELTDRGYNQYKLDFPQFNFNSENNTAILEIGGRIGKKVLSEVISPLSNPAIVGIVFGDDLHTLDKSITDPNTMKTEILRKFRDIGYQDIQISEPMVSYPHNDEILYTFLVDPGPQYTISEVQLEGILSIDRDEALQSMGLYSVINTAPLLTDKVVTDAVDILSALYADRGYWDAKVYYPKITKSKQTHTAKLTFNIKEGRQRIFDKLEIKGNSAFSKADILSHLKVEPEKSLTWKAIIDFQQNVKKIYRESGYLYAKVKIDLLQSTRFREVRTTLSLVLEEGIRAKFGAISISGLRRTDENVVRRELSIQEGDWYSPEALDDTRQSLIDLGLFSLVTISPSVSSDFIEEKEVIPYTVHIKESKPGQVNFGPGWSLQDGGRFTVDASYNNIQGVGRQVFLSGSYSEEINQTPIGNSSLLGYNLAIGYIEPYIFDFPVNGILTYNQYADAVDQQRELSKSIKSTLTRKFQLRGNKYNIGLFGLYKITQEEAEQDVEFLLNSDEIQIRELGIRGSWDSRNSNSWPTKGSVISLEASRAALILGADTEYWHWSATFNRYYSLNSQFVFACRIGLESFTNVVRTDSNGQVLNAEKINLLPSSERIKSGGAETNRGFKKNELGPIVKYTNEKGEPDELTIGGTQSVSFKIELRQLLTKFFGLTYFLDASNTYLTAQEAADFNTRLEASPQYKARLEDNFDYDFLEFFQHPSTIWKQNYISYGIALNYITPFGAINASYGYPLSRCPLGRQTCEKRGNSNFRNWRGGQIHFNVGTNF